MRLVDMKDRELVSFADVADADWAAIRIEGRDDVGECGQPRAVAAFDRHVLVHHVQHEIALSAADRDSPDVEGGLGVDDGLFS